MAVATIGKKSIREHAFRFWNQCTEQAGTLDKETAKKALAAFLTENLDLVNIDGIASNAIDEVDKALRPRHDPKQLSFFQPETFIPYGPRMRVRMADANLDHLEAYEAILDENFKQQTSAYTEAKSYIGTRRAAWQRTDRTLADVERRAFGWTEADAE